MSDDQAAIIELLHCTVASLQAKVKELTGMAEGYKRASHINESAKLKLRVKVEELEKRLRRFTACPSCGVQGGEHDARCNRRVSDER